MLRRCRRNPVWMSFLSYFIWRGGSLHKGFLQQHRLFYRSRSSLRRLNRAFETQVLDHGMPQSCHYKCYAQLYHILCLNHRHSTLYNFISLDGVIFVEKLNSGGKSYLQRSQCVISEMVGNVRPFKLCQMERDIYIPKNVRSSITNT